MRKHFLIFGLIFIFLLLSGVGCIQFGAKNNVNDGGIFKSFNQGENWLQKIQILAVGGQRLDFSNVNIISLVLDPSDNKAIYAGSAGSGLFYSYDAGDSWQQPPQLKSGVIKAIALDPKNKCVIYLSLGSQLLKSTDCNRTFEPIYQESRPEVIFNAVVVDSYNSNQIYVGTSVGDFLKSANAGRGWEVIHRFNNSILKIILNPLDTRKIYIATQDLGIFRTGDAGKSFTELNQGLKQYGGAFVLRDLLLTDAKSESLLLSSQYGLIKTGDGGVSWQALTLLTPPGGAEIRVMGVNPQNPKEIFYATPSTFYKSSDNGLKWTTKKLPSSRLPSVFLIDPTEPRLMYLGVLKIKK